MEEETKYEAFLKYTIQAFVNRPEAVKVERTVDEMGVLLSLTVDPMDMGLVVGRAGSTMKSIRTLTKIVGRSVDSHVNVKLLEPEGSSRTAREDTIDEHA